MVVWEDGGGDSASYPMIVELVLGVISITEPSAVAPDPGDGFRIKR